jgi:thiol-disulfide isomerase/thioredoxin
MVGPASLIIMAASLLAGAPASPLIPPGRPSPPLVARTMNGEVWRGHLGGEVTIVEFFATWCQHCRKSLASYQALLAARPVRVIVVDVDEDPLVVQDYFARHPLPRGARLLIDLEEHARRTWGVKEFPAVYLVDRRGVIRDSFTGWDATGGIRYLIREIDALQIRRPTLARGQKRGPPLRAHGRGAAGTR